MARYRVWSTKSDIFELIKSKNMILGQAKDDIFFQSDLVVMHLLSVGSWIGTLRESMPSNSRPIAISVSNMSLKVTISPDIADLVTRRAL